MVNVYECHNCFFYKTTERERERVENFMQLCITKTVYLHIRPYVDRNLALAPVRHLGSLHVRTCVCVCVIRNTSLYDRWCHSDKRIESTQRTAHTNILCHFHRPNSQFWLSLWHVSIQTNVSLARATVLIQLHMCSLVWYTGMLVNPTRTWIRFFGNGALHDTNLASLHES